MEKQKYLAFVLMCVCVYIAVISVRNVESVTMEAQQCVLFIAALRMWLSTMNTSFHIKCPLFFSVSPLPFLAKFEVS
jgi:ABC-type proline/glycine betaine transport system permease subunit